jgi:Rod binding domain-containing protein
MKPVALPPAALDPSGAALPQAAATPGEKSLKAAREFESILLRHMLESMQKTAELGGKSHTNSAYQSMATEALADGIERGGGLGLAELVAKTLEGEISGSKPR